jgi:uncharacterized protein YndB with AHSA1/START domain
VFDAFVEPAILERFWLRSASAPLEVGATVEWQFMAAGSSEKVKATELSPHSSIRFSWADGIDVAIDMQPFESTMTRVHVVARGFVGPAATSQAVAATAGFTIVLCDLKTLLESGRSANLVRDKAVLITADAKAAGH